MFQGCSGLFRGVPGVFRDVPGCSGVFRVLQTPHVCRDFLFVLT